MASLHIYFHLLSPTQPAVSCDFTDKNGVKYSCEDYGTYSDYPSAREGASNVTSLGGGFYGFNNGKAFSFYCTYGNNNHTTLQASFTYNAGLYKVDITQGGHSLLTEPFQYKFYGEVPSDGSTAEQMGWVVGDLYDIDQYNTLPSPPGAEYRICVDGNSYASYSVEYDGQEHIITLEMSTDNGSSWQEVSTNVVWNVGGGTVSSPSLVYSDICDYVIGINISGHESTLLPFEITPRQITISDISSQSN